MNNLCGNDFLTGPFDECIACEFLRNGCSGPRTNAMQLQRWIVWIKAVMRRFGISNNRIADGAQISKSTVDDIFAGRRKDISRETCCLIENYVLGDGKWPCARTLSDEADIVYEDRPETLEALRKTLEENAEKVSLVESLRETIKTDREQHLSEMNRLREYYEDDIKEYQELVAHMRDQVRRKDDYIDRLAKRAGI